MNLDNRNKVLLGVIVVLIVVAAILFTRGTHTPKEPPSASGYYTGAFRNKRDPNMWGDENGRPVPPPPDAIPVPASAHKSGPGALAPQ